LSRLVLGLLYLYLFILMAKRKKEKFRVRSIKGALFTFELKKLLLISKPEGKRPVGRPRHRWEDNIRRDLQEVGCGGMDWIGLAQDRDRWRGFVSTVMNLWVPQNAENFLTSCKPVSFSGRTVLCGVSE
jgi:hypothetical protein